MYAEIVEAVNNLKSLLGTKTDAINDRLDNVERELKLTRAGHEEALWGEKVEDMEDVDLEDYGLDGIDLS